MAKKSSQLIGQTIGNYKLTDVLGEGGMGSVYKAEHILIGKIVALKLLHEEYAEKPEIVRRFFTEAKSVNKIGHRNIVDISDYGQTEDGRPYFIMEYLNGTELAKEIERTGAFELKRALNIIRQAGSALEASHRAGIVHRDLKPENLFLLRSDNDQDFVKVLDFGIAKLQEGADSTNVALGHKTKTGMVMGTPAYMAPEQAEGVGVDQRTDIYSLGIILYEMLTGEQPFTADTFSRVLIKVLTEPIPAPRIKNPNIPHAIEQLLLKMVEKEQKNRFQSVSEFLAALKDAEANLGALGSSLPPATMPSAAPRNPSPTTLSGVASELHPAQTGGSHLGVIIGGAVATFAAAGAVVFLTLGPGKTWFSGESAPPAPAVSAVPAPAPEPAPTPAPAPEPAPASIAITFVSTPDGALVKEGDTILGPTPYLLTTTASETVREFSLSFTGYETKNISQALTKTDVIKTTLEKMVTASTEPEPPKETKGKAPKDSKLPKEKAPKDSKTPSEPGEKIDSTTTLVPSFGKKD